MGDSAHTTHHTNRGKKSAPPLFLVDETIFQKSAPLVALPQFLVQPTEPIFEKSSHLRVTGGVLMLVKTTPHLGAKAQYDRMYAKTPRS
jgi:hypothetical protein